MTGRGEIIKKERGVFFVALKSLLNEIYYYDDKKLLETRNFNYLQT